MSPGSASQSPQIPMRDAGEMRLCENFFIFLKDSAFNSPRSAFLHCEVFPSHLLQASEKRKHKPLAASSVQASQKKKKNLFLQLSEKVPAMTAAREHEGQDGVDTVHIYWHRENSQGPSKAGDSCGPGGLQACRRLLCNPRSAQLEQGPRTSAVYHAG